MPGRLETLSWRQLTGIEDVLGESQQLCKLASLLRLAQPHSQHAHARRLELQGAEGSGRGRGRRIGGGALRVRARQATARLGKHGMDIAAG
jgi:hypothetical protein